MLIIVTSMTVAGWLALWAVLAARTSVISARAASAAAGGRPALEPPAVVSLLARRLPALGYPATLLDLAARGWFRIEAQPGGPVMCVLANSRPGGELTAYEHRVYAHLVTRAGDRLDVPAAALCDGFAGSDGFVRPAQGIGAAKSAKDAFMQAFTADVIEESRRRGLSRPRLTGLSGCLLYVAAFVPAVASGLVLHADGNRAYWIPVAGFIALCTLIGIAVKGEKLTPAGRAALRGWRDRCTGQSAAASFGPAGSAGSAGSPHREVAYAAALGRARAAAELFSDTPGAPRGKAIWSSYGGHWRLITIGDPQPIGALSIVGIVLLTLLPPTLATAVLAHGELRAAALGVIALDAVIAVRLLTKNASVPAFTEFDGLVIEAWTETDSGENSTTQLCLAIDDGVRDRAWAFNVTSEEYRWCTPGTLVHAQVNPRRNKLLDIRPVSDRARLPLR